MIFNGNVGSIIQVLTLIVAVERGAAYCIKLWKSKGAK